MGCQMTGWLTRGWTPLYLLRLDQDWLVFFNLAEYPGYILAPDHPNYPVIVELAIQDACEIGVIEGEQGKNRQKNRSEVW